MGGASLLNGASTEGGGVLSSHLRRRSKYKKKKMRREKSFSGAGNTARVFMLGGKNRKRSNASVRRGKAPERCSEACCCSVSRLTIFTEKGGHRQKERKLTRTADWLGGAGVKGRPC